MHVLYVTKREVSIDIECSHVDRTSSVACQNIYYTTLDLAFYSFLSFSFFVPLL